MKLAKIDKLMQRDGLVLYADQPDRERQRLIYYFGPGWYSFVNGHYIAGEAANTPRILIEQLAQAKEARLCATSAKY